MRAILRTLRYLSIASVCVSLASTLHARSIDDPKPIVAEGASFTEPEGWVRLTPDKAKTKGWFISKDSERNNPKAMIMVDIGKPTEKDLRSTAEKLARNWGGKVLDDKTTLDGEEALHIKVENAGKGLRPIEAIVALKNGNLYMLMGGAIPGHSVKDEVEEVRKGWKWTK